MRKDANIIDKAKRAIKFLMGKELPKWVYPATAAVAAAPVLGYALEKKPKPPPELQPIPPWLQTRAALPGLVNASMVANQFPLLTGVHPSVFKYAHCENDMARASAAVSFHLGVKSAAGLDELNAVLREAKRRGRGRKALRTVDVKADQTKPGDGGPGARGISSGSAVAGNGGGYGK